MNPEPLVARVAASLETRGIRYAVVGAAALAAHGVARSTFDLDLLTTSTEVLHASTWDELSADESVRLDVRTGDADDPLRGLVRFEAAGERPVDVVVGRFSWQADVVARAVRVAVAGVSVPVVTAADLVLLKLFAGGSQDCWDVEQLLAGDDRRALVRDVELRLGPLPVEATRLWKRLATGR